MLQVSLNGLKRERPHCVAEVCNTPVAELGGAQPV
jgi:hypothetical protein